MHTFVRGANIPLLQFLCLNRFKGCLDIFVTGQAILLTADRDFGDLVFRQGQLTEGVVLIRLAGLPSTMKAELVSAIINQHAKELQQAFSVITPGSFRIRKINRLVWYDPGEFCLGNA